ncbi:MAG: hypothetical protein Kow00105_13720 [Phycisphaeraceae bacterium]
MRVSFSHRRIFIAPAVVLVGLLCGPHALASAMFQGLGDLPGGTEISSAFSVTPDGSVVVGASMSAQGFEAFKWDAINGMIGLGDLPGGDYFSTARGVSSDGMVVVGYSDSIHSPAGYEAFRWTPGSGMVGLGDLAGGVFDSRVMDVSADGSVLVGWSSSGSGNMEAFTWTSGSGMIGLGDLPGGSFDSMASDVSADGSVIVGRGSIEHNGNNYSQAFRWTASGGMVALEGLSTEAVAVSNDGSVVVGNYVDPTGRVGGVVWPENGTLTYLDTPVTPYDQTLPFDLSGDGSVIVGLAFTSQGPQAVIWDSPNNARLLQDVLTDLGLDLTGWTLESATGISDDGLTIVGTGINPAGHSEAFIVRLPEPATITLLTLATLTAVNRRKH